MKGFVWTPKHLATCIVIHIALHAYNLWRCASLRVSILNVASYLAIIQMQWPTNQD